ncbi:MAG: undecaprenyl/decaprenyl-phosphate alpha-N-acetylglucosaminyl 1-phosphate transferase [Planctomycetes bacterium]|nr:undecaprenyl/decaprenyl-phosphate alpha-N-acetylglucosaminyl 1-phosphate transferase [Planctomycetota bacterium]
MMLVVLAQLDPAGTLTGDLDLFADESQSFAAPAMDLLNSYVLIFIVAFMVTLLITPLVRRFAIAAGAIDRPDRARKTHPYPIAKFGGVAVFLGLIVAIGTSYVYMDGVAANYRPLPIAIVLGMVAIMFTGLADDLWGWDPRLKIAGQLVAAAALAINDIGVRVAEGVLKPFMGGPDDVIVLLGSFHVLNGHVFYWIGTAIIAVFVLGGCNAANLIDGLDGLLSGVTGIVALGLLAICLLVAPQANSVFEARQAEAVEVASTVQSQIDRYGQEQADLPGDLSALVAAGYLAALPEPPVGWVLAYDDGRGEVSAKDDRTAAAARIVETVQRRVQQYRNDTGHFPREIETLVEAGYITATPQMPVQYPLRYNPNLGQVTATLEAATLAGARILLCMALLGAVLGFLPHNFNPASIFLGDSGSLLLGYLCVVIILMLGEQGATHLVFAGLIVFSVPIMDTTLAIIRRWLAGTSMSAADDQHIHHQLRRALGGVKRAVFAVYGMGFAFAVLGVVLAALVLKTDLRVRVIYAIALVLFGFIGLFAVKAARRQHHYAVSQPQRLSKPQPSTPASARQEEDLRG